MKSNMGSINNFDDPGNQVLQPIKLAHVVLRTRNSKRQRDFYLAFLGGRVQYENDSLCFITYDDEHHRLALVNIPELPDKVRNSAGLEHIAFSFATLSDLLMAYRQRLKRGIKPVWCVNHGPTLSMYYKDTDGNMLETQVDVWEEAEMANKFMMSEEFAQNPIGVDFDPEELIERIKNGEKQEDLMIRPKIGPRSLPEEVLN